MFDKVLLIPGARGADEPVFRRAESLAASLRSEVEVFEPVYEPLLEGYYGDKELYEPLRRRLVAERLEAAQALADELRAQGHEATAHAAWGHPLYSAIASRANARDVDLVVTQPLEGHRGALAHADWRLIATCPVPVLVVKGEARGPYRKIVAAVDPIHAHAKPAALDETILVHAKALAAQFDAELAVVHCFVPLSELGGGAEVGPWPIEAAEKALEDVRRGELETLVANAGLPASAIRLESGRPHRVLGAMLDNGECDLVIMGALSRGRLKDFVIGSTAERVLHRAHGDVLAIKPAVFGQESEQ